MMRRRRSMIYHICRSFDKRKQGKSKANHKNNHAYLILILCVGRYITMGSPLSWSCFFMLSRRWCKSENSILLIHPKSFNLRSFCICHYTATPRPARVWWQWARRRRTFQVSTILVKPRLPPPRLSMSFASATSFFKRVRLKFSKTPMMCFSGNKIHFNAKALIPTREQLYPKTDLPSSMTLFLSLHPLLSICKGTVVTRRQHSAPRRSHFPVRPLLKVVLKAHADSRSSWICRCRWDKTWAEFPWPNGATSGSLSFVFWWAVRAPFCRVSLSAESGWRPRRSTHICIKCLYKEQSLMKKMGWLMSKHASSCKSPETF